MVYELEAGKYKKAEDMPTGLVYQDVNDFLVKLYKCADFASIGLKLNGAVDTTLTE